MKKTKDIYDIRGPFFIGLMIGCVSAMILSYYMYMIVPGKSELLTKLNRCEMIVEQFIKS